MPDGRGGDIQRVHLCLELLRVVDQRQQVRERNQLAVVEEPAHEARVVVPALLPVGHDVDPRPKLRVDRKPGRVLGCSDEVRLRQPALDAVVDRLEHPARAWPAADPHDREGADLGGRTRRREDRRDRDGDDTASNHGARGTRSASEPLQTRKLRSRPCRTRETS
jgi:hypothetical protein